MVHVVRYKYPNPVWVEDYDLWFFKLNGEIVGEVYPRGGIFRWHCHTTDWREMRDTVEEAKLACEADYWKEEAYKLRDEFILPNRDKES